MTLRLSHTPCEWDTSFAMALSALARDLLIDGPIEVSIVLDEQGPDGFNLVGTLFEVDDQAHTMSIREGRNVQVVEFDEVISVEFA